MAARKYYAVKKGRVPGIFHTWEECRASVEGYPGAEYKGFARLDEAQEYMGITGSRPGGGIGLQPEKAAGPDVPLPGTLKAYVDGSFDISLKKYAFGCVFILPDGRTYTEYGNGDNEQSLQLRNVTGEMLGAMYAVKVAMANGYSGVELCYDYEGIEKWVTGRWRAKTDLTAKYAKAMREWGESIEIAFTKVTAHTNVYYNEMADQTAKTGLREGNGIPPILRFEDDGKGNPGFGKDAD